MQLAFLPPAASPIRRQYLALKSEHPDAILFFQLGDFYETFEDDARTVSEVRSSAHLPRDGPGRATAHGRGSRPCRGRLHCPPGRARLPCHLSPGGGPSVGPWQRIHHSAPRGGARHLEPWSTRSFCAPTGRTTSPRSPLTGGAPDSPTSISAPRVRLHRDRRRNMTTSREPSFGGCSPPRRWSPISFTPSGAAPGRQHDRR